MHGSAARSSTTATPESELEALWDAGQRPDVAAFLAARGSAQLTTEALVSLLWVDQRRRWSSGERVDLHSYPQRFPVLREEPEAFFELLYHEIVVREGLGEEPDPADYARAFPELAHRLKLQFEVHDALSSVDLSGDNSEDFTPGDRSGEHSMPEFSGYEMLDEVGRGGMGIVFRARQLRPARLVALKMILDGRFASEQELHRFENEVEAIAALDHPNVVPILEVGQQGALHYFTMPFLSGGSLAEAQQRLLAEPRKSAQLLIEIAGAVHHAHCRGILHRDLKPANILLDEAGRPYVTDFGLAKRSQAGTELTKKGDVLGSPGFMAPEQAAGDSSAVTTATDVYGLGAILYALLTGRAPFAERSFHQTIARLQSDPPEPPSRVSRTVPRALELICLKCLEKEPARRYPSAQALAQDLKRYLAGEPVEARPVSTSARLWLWVRRHPTQSALAGALGIALVCGAAIATTLWLRAEASLKAERSARGLLQLTTEQLNRSYVELEHATQLERDARLRAQERFDLALRAVQDTIHGPGNTSILLLTDAQATRQGVLQRIVELYKKLHESLEGDHTPEGRSQLAGSYERLGDLTAEIGSVDVARAAYAKAHEIRRELSASSPGDRLRLYDVAISVITQAKFERSAGEPARALELYRQGHAQLEALALTNPNHQRLWGDLAWCLGNVGALELRNDPEKAFQTHSKVLEIRERLIRNNPKDVTLRSDRAWGRLDIALCLRALNRRTEAISWVEHARAEFEAAHVESPRDVNITVRLVDCLVSLADANSSSSDHAASLDASQRACALNEELAGAYPNVPMYQEMLARNLRLHYQRQTEARLPGRASLERATKIYQELVKTYPGVSHFRSELIRALLNLSSLSREDGDGARAFEFAQRAVDLCGILSLDPTSDLTIANTANCHLHLAMAAADVKKTERCASERRAAEDLMRQLSQPSALLLYNRACCLALLARLTPGLSDRDALENLAMDAVWQAFRAGYRNRRVLAEDHDIDALRKRPEFKLLRLDLDFPANPIAR